MSPEEIYRLRELCEKATPGEWIAIGWGDDPSEDEVVLIPMIMQAFKPHVLTVDGGEYDCDGCDDCLLESGKSPDAAFIEAARTALPQLLDELQNRDEEKARLVAKLRQCAADMLAEDDPLDESGWYEAKAQAFEEAAQILEESKL